MIPSNPISKTQDTTKPDYSLNGVKSASLSGVKTEGLTIQLIEDKKQFNELELEWDPLVEISDGTIYSSFDWLMGWWHHFGKHPNRKIHIITIRDHGKLVCIAPFYVGKSSILGVTIQRRLKLMGDGTSKNESFGYRDNYGRSDFLDIICHPDYADSVAGLLYNMLNTAAYKDTYDFFECLHVNDRSFIKTHLIPVFKVNRIGFQISESDICPSVEFEETFEEDYLYEVSSNTRRRLRQSLKAIGKKDGFIVEEITDEEELDRNFRVLHDMHQSRWNSIGFPGAFLDQRFGPFLLEFIHKAHHKNRLWFKIAKDQSGCCATRIAMKFNGRYFDYMSGFEYNSPSSKYRPGIGLLTLMIKEGIEQGNQSLELLRGDEGYKFDLTSKVYKNWRWKVPFRADKSMLFKFLAQFTNLLSLIYFLMDKERNLLKVQRQLHSSVLMIFKYITVRSGQLKEKFFNE